MGYSQIVDVCVARNGERCKDCLFYGKSCEKFKRAHRGKIPIEIDEDKSKEQRRFFH